MVSLLWMLVGERSTLVLIVGWAMGRRALKRLPLLNVRTSTHFVVNANFQFLEGHFHGSVFVTLHARTFLDSMSLNDLRYLRPSYYLYQVFFSIHPSMMTWTMSSVASIRQQNYDSGIRTTINMSSLALQGTTTRCTIFDSVS